jgi:SnoaL-like domain
MNDLIDRYLACWNETDSAVRRDLITKTWAADASYIDPLVNAQGHDAIDAAIAATQSQFPGLVFALAGPVGTHHDVARFSWGLGGDGDEPLVIGSDVASVSADGRLARVVGFLDKVPSGAITSDW